MRLLLVAPLLALLTGSLVYCVCNDRPFRYRHSGAPCRKFPPVSCCGRCGAEDNTEANLRSLFAQQYRSSSAAFVHDAQTRGGSGAPRDGRIPSVPARLIVAARRRCRMRGVSLRALIPQAAHETLAMTDSDIRLRRLPATVTSELAQRRGTGDVPVSRAADRAVVAPRALGLNTTSLPAC